MSSQLAPSPDSVPRRFARIKLAAQIIVSGEGLSAVTPFQTKDVSEGGVFIYTHDLLPVGTRVDFTLVLGEKTASIRGRGEVVRVVTEDDPDAQGPGLALMFVDMPPEEQARIHHLLNTIRTQPAGVPSS